MQFAFPSCYSCCNSADFFFKVEIEREREREGKNTFFLFSFSNGLQEKKRNLFSRVIINEDDSMKIREGNYTFSFDFLKNSSLLIDQIGTFYSSPPSNSRLKFQKTIPAIRTIFIEQIGQK